MYCGRQSTSIGLVPSLFDAARPALVGKPLMFPAKNAMSCEYVACVCCGNVMLGLFEGFFCPLEAVRSEAGFVAGWRMVHLVTD